MRYHHTLVLRRLRPVNMCMFFLAGFGMLLLSCESPPNMQQSGSDGDHHKHDQFYESIANKAEALYFSQPDSTRKIATKALQSARTDKDLYWEARFLNLLGITYSVQSNYEKALPHFYEAFSIALDLDSVDLAGSISNNLGNNFKNIGNHKEGLSSYLMARHYYKKTNNKTNRAKVDNNIGILYGDIGNYVKAQAYCRQALNGFRLLEDTIGMDTSLSNLATLYLKTDMPDSALHYYHQAMELQEITGNKYNLSVVLKGIGDTYLHLADYDLAIDYYKKSDVVAGEKQFSYQQTEAKLGLAKVFLTTNQSDKAFAHTMKALDLARAIELANLEKQAHHLLSQIYSHEKNHEESLKHFQHYHDIRQDLIDQTKIHQIYNLEIEELSKDREIQQLEIERQRLLLSRRATMIWLIAIASVFIISTLLFLYYIYLNRIKQRQKNELSEARLRVTKEMTQAALNAEIAERKRLGFELHDGVGPLLSLAKLNVTALVKKPEIKNSRSEPILNNTVETINHILKEMKNISHNMAPLILLEKGFIEAIRDLVNKVNQSSNYDVSLKVSGFRGPLQAYLEHALYRSIQEALNNILTHANGSEVQIQIIQNHEDLTVMIEDNGVGFEPASLKQNKGIGIKSAASRIRSLKGEFLIDSAKGRGTIITIIIPLDNTQT